jgi:hypothetical protein
MSIYFLKKIQAVKACLSINAEATLISAAETQLRSTETEDLNAFVLTETVSHLELFFLAIWLQTCQKPKSQQFSPSVVPFEK